MRRFFIRRRLIPWLSIGLLLAGSGVGLGLGLAAGPGLAAVPVGRTPPPVSSRPPGTPTPPTTTTTPTTQPPAAPVVSVARLQPGLGVVGIANAPDPVEASLELTTDFVHWRDVTPPIPGPDSDGDAYRFIDASFLDPRQGWVVAYAQGRGSLLLYRTTDGGATWLDEGETQACGSACPEYVDFITPMDGWRELVGTMAGAAFLARTDDGGKTWSPVQNPATWPPSGLVSLADFQNGFLADTLPPSGALVTTGNSLANFHSLWATTDGGATWQERVVALPADDTTAVPYVDLPTFMAGTTTGVLPIALFTGSATAIAFYTSSDAGVTWSLRSIEATGSRAPQGDEPWPAISNVTGDLDGVLPSVGVAGPGTWWVVSGAWPADPVVHVTSNDGSSWSTVTARGLTPLISSIQAVSATTAWATTDTSGCGLVGTTDGGATWQPVCPGT
jgi:hypothetical protein